MLDDAPIVAFVASTDLDRSRAFFVDVLGLAVESADDIALVLRGAGTTVRVARVDAFTPQPFTVLGWVVPDAAAAVAALSARGVAFTRYDGMGQDSAGIWTAPGGARIAWFTDPDGNTLSVTEHR